jgi:hypothetical protein
MMRLAICSVGGVCATQGAPQGDAALLACAGWGVFAAAGR